MDYSRKFNQVEEFFFKLQNQTEHKTTNIQTASGYSSATAEAVIRRWSVKEVFLETLQNSQENTCTRDFLTQVFPCEFCEVSKNTFFYRTPLVAASATAIMLVIFWTELCIISGRRNSCNTKLLKGNIIKT